jgi:hypothetical protein
MPQPQSRLTEPEVILLKNLAKQLDRGMPDLLTLPSEVAGIKALLHNESNGGGLIGKVNAMHKTFKRVGTVAMLLLTGNLVLPDVTQLLKATPSPTVAQSPVSSKDDFKQVLSDFKKELLDEIGGPPPVPSAPRNVPQSKPRSREGAGIASKPKDILASGSFAIETPSGIPLP